MCRRIGPYIPRHNIGLLPLPDTPECLQRHPSAAVAEITGSPCNGFAIIMVRDAAGGDDSLISIALLTVLRITAHRAHGP